MQPRPPLPNPRPLSATLDPALRAIRAHYLEMPGLSLTPLQARRLCGLSDVEPGTCQQVLDQLVADRFLQRSPDGRYRRAA